MNRVLKKMIGILKGKTSSFLFIVSLERSCGVWRDRQVKSPDTTYNYPSGLSLRCLHWHLCPHASLIEPVS